MRVLLIVHGYPPLHLGGAEQRAERTARGLAAHGHQVRVLSVETVAAGHADIRWEDHVQDGILVRSLRFELAASPDPFRWSYDNPQVALALERLLDEWHPDVIHLVSGYLITGSILYVAAARQIPTVVSLTDYWWLCHRINLLRSDGTRCDGPTAVGCARCYADMSRRFQLLNTLWPAGVSTLWRLAEQQTALGEWLGVQAQETRNQQLRESLQLADALIAPSRYLADMYIQHGIDPQRIRVWRQGVQLNQCLLRHPSDRLRVGYIGQMKPHKGVHLLLDAWSMLKGTVPRQLTLYGSDQGEESYGARMRAQIERLSHVNWAGRYRGEQVWKVLSDLDVLVVPSRWVENSPNVILEAQAVGVPVIGTNLGGIAELVQHEENGLLFSVDDPEDLARQLQRLLDEPELLPQLRRRHIPFQSLEDEINRLEGLYTELRVSQPHEQTLQFFGNVAEQSTALVTEG